MTELAFAAVAAWAVWVAWDLGKRRWSSQQLADRVTALEQLHAAHGEAINKLRAAVRSG